MTVEGQPVWGKEFTRFGPFRSEAAQVLAFGGEPLNATAYRADPDPVVLVAPSINWPLQGRQIRVTGAEDYARQLREAGVEHDGEERAEILLGKARSLAADCSGTIESDADLIPTLADLVEWPGLVCGSFDAAYLELPE